VGEAKDLIAICLGSNPSLRPGWPEGALLRRAFTLAICRARVSDRPTLPYSLLSRHWPARPRRAAIVRRRPLVPAGSGGPFDDLQTGRTCAAIWICV